MSVVAVVPLKFSSTRLKLKNILPVDGVPSFILVCRTLTKVADKTILVHEEGYAPYVDMAKSYGPYYPDIEVYEAPYPIHGEESTVADVVNYGMKQIYLDDYETLLVAYPTAFNLQVDDIERVMKKDGHFFSVMANGQDAGCLYKISMDGWRRSKNYVDEESAPFYFGDHLVDINTEEDFIFAGRQRQWLDVNS